MSRFDDLLGVVAFAMLAWLGVLAAQPLPSGFGGAISIATNAAPAGDAPPSLRCAG